MKENNCSQIHITLRKIYLQSNGNEGRYPNCHEYHKENIPVEYSGILKKNVSIKCPGVICLCTEIDFT